MFFFKQCLIFLFITSCHPERDSGSHFIFKKFLILFLFITSLFLFFFIKIITTSSKGKEPAQSPKPAVSLPLNPSLLGHGSGLRPKNLPTSKVSSVSCEQIRVELFFFKIFFGFSFITSLFLFFFIKIIITSLRGRNQFRVRSPQF